MTCLRMGGKDLSTSGLGEVAEVGVDCTNYVIPLASPLVNTQALHKEPRERPRQCLTRRWFIIMLSGSKKYQA